MSIHDWFQKEATSKDRAKFSNFQSQWSRNIKLAGSLNHKGILIAYFKSLEHTLLNDTVWEDKGAKDRAHNVLVSHFRRQLDKVKEV